MQAAARLLVGTHDFAAFQAKGGRVTTVRTIFDCHVSQDAATGRVSITCEGDGFLYKMVRIIAGTLLKVSMRLAETSVVTDMIKSCHRSLAGPPLPARYLTLEHVEYDLEHPKHMHQGASGTLSQSVQERKRERERTPTP